MLKNGSSSIWEGIFEASIKIISRSRFQWYHPPIFYLLWWRLSFLSLSLFLLLLSPPSFSYLLCIYSHKIKQQVYSWDRTRGSIWTSGSVSLLWEWLSTDRLPRDVVESSHLRDTQKPPGHSSGQGGTYCCKFLIISCFGICVLTFWKKCMVL